MCANPHSTEGVRSHTTPPEGLEGPERELNCVNPFIVAVIQNSHKFIAHKVEKGNGFMLHSLGPNGLSLLGRGAGVKL